MEESFLDALKYDPDCQVLIWKAAKYFFFLTRLKALLIRKCIVSII